MSWSAESTHTAVSEPRLGLLVGAELRKLIKRPLTWIVFALAGSIGAAYLFAYAVAATQGRLDTVAAQMFPPASIVMAFARIWGLGIIGLALLGAGIASSEYGWGTMRLLVATGAHRTRLLAAKLGALGIASVAWVLLGVAAATAGSLLANVLSGRPVQLGTLDVTWFGDLGMMVVRTLLASSPLLLMAFAVAIVTRSFAGGIAAPFIWQVAEAGVGALAAGMGRTGELVRDLLIQVNTNGLMSYNGFGHVAPEQGTPGAWQAAVVIIAYDLVLLAVAFAVFQRRDLAASS